MKYKKLGKSDLMVSTVGLGTWAIGGGPWWGESDKDASIAAIKTALEFGINLIDTAPAYGFGYSEEVVGEAIKGNRSKVILSTKCGLWWETEENNFFFEQDNKKVYRSLKSSNIRKELENSLRRLQTDYIDIYHTHWQDSTTPISDTAEVLLQLQKEGKIRTIAVSNATIEDCKKYEETCMLAANQAKYSMLDRQIEDSLASYCLDNDIGILAYSPLEQGLLTGKVTIDSTFSLTDTRSNNPWYEVDKRSKVILMLKGFTDLTEKYNCTLSQLVIAWTRQQRGITSVLCGARNPKNAMENAINGDLELEECDLSRMRKDVLRINTL